MKLEEVCGRIFLVLNLREIVGSLIVFNPIISVLINIPLGLDSTEELKQTNISVQNQIWNKCKINVLKYKIEVDSSEF